MLNSSYDVKILNDYLQNNKYLTSLELIYRNNYPITVANENNKYFIYGDFNLYFIDYIKILKFIIMKDVSIKQKEKILKNIMDLKTEIEVNKFINNNKYIFDEIFSKNYFKKDGIYINYIYPIEAIYYFDRNKGFISKLRRYFYLEDLKIRINENLLTYVTANGNHPHLNNNRLCVSVEWKKYNMNLANLEVFINNLKIINLENAYNYYDVKKKIKELIIKGE